MYEKGSIVEAIERFREMGEVFHRVPTRQNGRRKLSGVYILLHLKTGKMYVGSTSDLYTREIRHIEQLVKKVHHNVALQSAYSDDSRIVFMYVLTKDREQAYDFEQQILDIYHAEGLLFNVARDARSSNKNASPEVISRISQKTKAMWADEAIRNKIIAAQNHPETVAKNIESNKKRWADPSYYSKMVAARNTPEYLEWARSKKKDKMKPIVIDDVVYDSITGAARELGMRRQTIKDRLRSKEFPNYRFHIAIENSGGLNA